MKEIDKDIVDISVVKYPMSSDYDTDTDTLQINCRGAYQQGRMQERYSECNVKNDWNGAMKLYEQVCDLCDDNDEEVPPAITEALCNPDLESFMEELKLFFDTINKKIKNGRNSYGWWALYM